MSSSRKQVCLSLLPLFIALAMGVTKAADCVIIQNVGICDICGAPGFEECLAVCTQCTERAEHVYCMQTLCDAVPLNWVCEGCKNSTVLEINEVQSERDLCANLMTDKVKENENKKTKFSQRKSSAKTSERRQKHDNKRQGSEEFEMETTRGAEHLLSSGVSRKLSFLILSAEDGFSKCASDENSSNSHKDCFSPVAPYHQSDLERVCHGLKVDGLTTATNLQSNDLSALNDPQYFTIPPVTSGALEHPPPTSSNPLGPTSCSPPLSRSTEHGLPLIAWNSNMDNAEVIDMEIDVDSDDGIEIAQGPLSAPRQPDFPWTLLDPPFPDSGLPPLPPDLPSIQPSPPVTLLESGAQEESSLLPPLPPGSPPAQPSPPSTPGDRISLDNGSPRPPSAPPSPRPLTSPRSHLVHAPESNLDSSAFSKGKSPGQEGDYPTNANLESLASQLDRKWPQPGAHADNGREGDYSTDADLESLASGLDKKRPRPASYTDNMITRMSRETPRYGSQSDIFEILSSSAQTSRSKMQTPSKKQDLALESQKRSCECADGHKHLCSSDQQVKNDEKNASSVIQLCKGSFKSPGIKLLDNVSSAASKIRTESGLGNQKPHLLSSTRSSSDLTHRSSVEQAILKWGTEGTRFVPWVPLEDGEVVPPSGDNPSSCLDRNGVCTKQDATADINDEDLIREVGGDRNVEDVRRCENARDIYVRQVLCLPLFPGLESSSVFDRTGILADLLSEHDQLLSDLSWQMMPLVQQLEEPWYKPPLPNLNEPALASSLEQSLLAWPDEDFALTLRLPQYRKHGNIWITIESDTRTCYDENVKLSLSCCSL